ncbi:alkene reductase [Salinibacterium sp.]|uniref:alkene reductase n=1 Tax=Salinibacterium sp. TaxID=1915057 RepID=UPI00286A966A|nr:alkene reductase [Salinibacterium sp.]
MQLFSPTSLGALALSNRIVMAPLTRMRAGVSGEPNDMMVEYYRQRASLGMIVSEGVFTSDVGRSNPGQPGIVTVAQIAGWRRVTEAVHAEGGTIVMQLMHGGRVSHEDTTGGLTPVAPSAIAIKGETYTPLGKKAFPTPRALTESEVGDIVTEHVAAATRAIEAGFDGVELHSANGYLLHEFLSPVSNVRDDSYGGSPEKRAKLGIDVATAVAGAIGGDRVGIRISPSHNIQDVLEEDADVTRATYDALITGLAPLGLAYLSVLHAQPDSDLVQDLRARFGGPLVVNSGFGGVTGRDEAAELVEAGTADAVAVGRPVIANPDLVERWKEGAPINEADPTTFYTPTAEGYTDYPALAS